jgi:[acyl-carrier-protein] S-malonyltransferase
MGKAWAEKYPAAKAVFEQANAIVGFDLSTLCFEGPEDRLNRTDIAQAAIYTTSVACYRALSELGQIGNVAATVGLSLGEFTALHLAGAFDFATGLKLVQLRGQAMQDAAEAVVGGSGMVALVGADEPKAQLIVEQALAKGKEAGASGEVLVCANFNCPGQIVLSGSQSACDRSVAAASENGVKAVPLKVAGAFHSPLMKPAADRLGAALEQVKWEPAKVPVMSNVTGKPHETTAASIQQRLVEQLTHPVRLEEDLRWLIANVGGARYVELAPNKVLLGNMRKIDRNIKVENFAEPV